MSTAEDDIETELEEILLETSWTEDGVGLVEAGKVVKLLRPSTIDPGLET